MFSCRREKRKGEKRQSKVSAAQAWLPSVRGHQRVANGSLTRYDLSPSGSSVIGGSTERPGNNRKRGDGSDCCNRRGGGRRRSGETGCLLVFLPSAWPPLLAFGNRPPGAASFVFLLDYVDNSHYSSLQTRGQSSQARLHPCVSQMSCSGGERLL